MEAGRTIRLASTILVVVILGGAAAAKSPPKAPAGEAGSGKPADPYAGLAYRFIGPPGNRLSAVVGVAGDPNTYYRMARVSPRISRSGLKPCADFKSSLITAGGKLPVGNNATGRADALEGALRAIVNGSA